MELSKAILQTIDEAEDLLTSTSMDLRAVAHRPELAIEERQHLRVALDRISLMRIEARTRLQEEWNGSHEQEYTFIENSKQLIRTLNEVKAALASEQSIARIFMLVDSICPLWPFC
jgi:hypothetical protein